MPPCYGSFHWNESPLGHSVFVAETVGVILFKYPVGRLSDILDKEIINFPITVISASIAKSAAFSYLTIYGHWPSCWPLMAGSSCPLFLTYYLRGWFSATTPVCKHSLNAHYGEWYRGHYRIALHRAFHENNIRDCFAGMANLYIETSL